MEPSKGGRHLLRTRPRRHRDIGPMGHVSFVTIGPARPSSPSRRHPGHFSAILDAVGLRGDKTLPGQLLCTPPPPPPRQLHPRVSVRTTTKWGTSTPPPSKPSLDGRRARHDAPPEAKFARKAVHSVALSAMPSHVARTVRHACKLPPPWPIKGGAVPWPQGDDDNR
jgi:hypothetical protein